MEKAYWEYVKANDLQKYRALWHENFVGWPFVSSAPVRKDHITDWITANTSKGITLQSYWIEQLAIQVTGEPRSIIIELRQRGRTAQAPKSGPTKYGSRTHGLDARHVANHRRHVLASESRGPVAKEFIRPQEKKARPKNDLAFWVRWPTTNCCAAELFSVAPSLWWDITSLRCAQAPSPNDVTKTANTTIIFKNFNPNRLLSQQVAPVCLGKEPRGSNAFLKFFEPCGRRLYFE